MGVTRDIGYKVEVIDLSTTDTVAPAGQDIFEFKPDDGFIYEVINIYFSMPDPAGSGSGTHTLYIRDDNMDNALSLYWSANFGNALSQNYQGHSGSYASRIPSAASDMIKLCSQALICVSNSCPLEFVYTNGTDVDQSGNRKLFIRVKKRRVV